MLKLNICPSDSMQYNPNVSKPIQAVSKILFVSLAHGNQVSSHWSELLGGLNNIPKHKVDKETTFVKS